MKILIEVDTDTNRPFNLDTNDLQEWFEDQINAQIDSNINEDIEYARPTVKILEKNND